MNNLEAYSLLKSHNDSISDATRNFLELFQVPQTEFENFRYRFRGIISERRVFRKRGQLENWNSQVFLSPRTKRESVDPKKIATLSLEVLANRGYDRKTTKVCKEIISTGTFAPSNCMLAFDKAATLIDILEIGKKEIHTIKAHL